MGAQAAEEGNLDRFEEFQFLHLWWVDHCLELVIADLSILVLGDKTLAFVSRDYFGEGAEMV